MTSQTIPVEPFDLVVFGATGDLSERKLLPALYQRQRAGQFTDPTRIIGSSRTKLSDEEFRTFAEKAIREHVAKDDIEPKELKHFLARLSYVPADAKSGEGFADLKTEVGDSKSVRAFYMAVAPSLFDDIVGQVDKHGLSTDTARVIVEKPIGRSLASAHELNDAIATTGQCAGRGAPVGVVVVPVVAGLDPDMDDAITTARLFAVVSAGV